MTQIQAEAVEPTSRPARWCEESTKTSFPSRTTSTLTKSTNCWSIRKKNVAEQDVKHDTQNAALAGSLSGLQSFDQAGHAYPQI